jgi:hydroxymethylglutaryl-CoA lyase
MAMANDIDVLVSEVGPRDGLQNAKQFMPTEYKKRWISAAAAAGLREIEVCSFVPPKLIPQMIDAAEIVAHARTIPHLTVAALAPNLKGALRAMEAGAHKITLPVSVSHAHSLANVRKTPDQMMDEVRRICEARDELPKDKRPKIESGLSTVFGCTIQGEVKESEVLRLAVASMEAGCDEVGLADTTGMANPAQIRRLYKLVEAEIGHVAGLHIHNTRGLGLANVLAGLDIGVRTFDASLAGLGGCPFAPGASGNVVTEDLVYLLEAMGFRTGVDLDKLIAVRKILSEGIPDEPLYGYVAAAGVTGAECLAGH